MCTRRSPHHCNSPRGWGGTRRARCHWAGHAYPWGETHFLDYIVSVQGGRSSAADQSYLMQELQNKHFVGDVQRSSGLFRMASARHRQNKEGNAKNTPSFFVDRASFLRRLECGILYIDCLRNAPPFARFLLARTRAYQLLFVFYLHLFTSLLHLAVYHYVRCEGFSQKGPFPFTQIFTSPSREYLI